ncbi:H+/gluconate symporter [Oribacterium sp. KHPX15]|uniref:GntP family permease n=1 Tax=Oribacterium sp. KHPX15 TaxID=1855342 RepID=UPI000898F4EB|nr:SLC13 family permease [Oribacterium sp. KHPX15]SEA91916.1 H+/gluconate symporter [Oribacterium sp. KHPX15]
MLGILSLVLAIACVITLIWKNWHMAIVSLAGALIVILLNGMDPVTSLSEKFMTGMSGFAGNWFLLFMLGAIFGKVMGDSGASVGIANKMLKLLGEKSVVLVVMLTGLVLSYGGIGTFIIAFSLYPIAVALFQKADIPKKLIVATIMVCPVTVCMAMLPGSPSTQNLIPTTYFGTTAYAGATIGIICSVIMFASAYLYLNYQIKKAKQNGEHFVASEGEDIMDLSAVDEGKTPSIGACFAPIIVLLALMFGIQFTTEIPSTYAVAIAMTAAIIVGCVLYKDRLNVKQVVSNGASGGLGSLIATSSIMGFGAVVSASPAYERITTALVNMNANPLITALISINVIAAITGSSAGGLNIFLGSMGDYLAASSLNLSMLHRVVCIASSGFDAMPHASGMVVCNQIAKTSQKDTYKYVFITCAIMPFCCAIFACILGTIGII